MLRADATVDRLRTNTSSLSDQVPLAVLLAVVPVPLTIGLGVAYGAVMGVTAADIGTAGNNLAYGCASIVVLLAMWGLLTSAQREAVFLFRRPDGTELIWTVLFFLVGVVVFPVVTVLAETAGAPAPDGFTYTLADTRTVIAVVFGGVVVAPLVEELLFRGYLLGSLLGRGVSPVLAGAATIALFAVIHLPLWGVAGVIGISAWSVLPTVLRLRFDTVTSPWLLHAANNLWSNLGIVALGFV